MKAGSAELLSFLATRHARAQGELDELRQRGLELVIASCIVELRETTSEAARRVPVDTSAFAEADIAAKPSSAPEAQPGPEPKEDQKSENVWEWLAPEEPPTLEDEPEPSVDGPEPGVEAADPSEEEPEVAERPSVRSVERSEPAPPVSADPAVEDVRGAWNPPPGG